MPVLKYFSSELAPVDGLASIKFADDDDVYDVVNAIYALYKDTRIKGSLTADNLRLVKLVCIRMHLTRCAVATTQII